MYCIFNQKYSKEEYFEKIKDILDMKNIKEMMKKFTTMKTTGIHRTLAIDHTENTYGNNIQYAKNTSYSFDCSNVEDIKFCQFVQDAKNIYDADYCCCEAER